MLAGMWSNWNSRALLMGMQSGTATLENDWAVPYKVKHILTIQPSNPITSYLPRRNENTSAKILYAMFIATSFTIIKVWKQSKCHLVNG